MKKTPKNHLARRATSRKNRKTKKCGGALATNIVRGFTHDREISKNYHESIIRIESVDYVVRYIVPDHFLFKTPDQVFKNPEFDAVLSGKRYPKCLFTIEDTPAGGAKPFQQNITMFVKIQSKQNPNAFYWFAVTGAGDQVRKTGQFFNYIFYSVKAAACQMNNQSNVISIGNAKMYEKRICATPKSCTVVFKTGPSGALSVVPKESLHQKILFNFFIQQEAQEQIKTDIAVESGFWGLDWMFKWA